MDRRRYFALRLDGRLIIAALLGFVLVLGVRVYRHTGEFTGFASLRTSRPSLLPVSRKLLSCGSVRVGLQVHWESRLEASGVFFNFTQLTSTRQQFPQLPPFYC